MRLCNTFWEPNDIVNATKEDVVQNILLGMMSQAAEAEDNLIVDDLRSTVFIFEFTSSI